MKECVPQCPFASPAVVKIVPGDTLMFRLPHSLPLTRRVKLQELFEANFPENKILILDAGMDFAVMRSS